MEFFPQKLNNIQTFLPHEKRNLIRLTAFIGVTLKIFFFPFTRLMTLKANIFRFEFLFFKNKKKREITY